jgi:hypothetical protein
VGPALSWRRIFIVAALGFVAESIWMLTLAHRTLERALLMSFVTSLALIGILTAIKGSFRLSNEEKTAVEDVMRKEDDAGVSLPGG